MTGGGGKSAIHLVSAWARDNGLLLGQLKVADKSNEITAIPELLRALELAGCIVTIDAMGAQKQIAREIIDKEHGRIETRRYWITEEISWLEDRALWEGLRSVGMVESIREVDGQTSTETRFFLCSLRADAGKFARAARGHWGIENQLHWSLDVTFAEDQYRVRASHTAENLALLRHLTLNTLKRDTTRKRGLCALQLLVSDDHAGLAAARRAVFPSVPWQRCQFHLQQSAQAYVPRLEMVAKVAADIRSIFNCADRPGAERRLAVLLVAYSTSAPKLSFWLETAIPEGFTVFAFPAAHQRRLRTSNALERVNQELKRRTRVARIFPNEASLLRLLSALLAETSDEWESSKSYLDMNPSSPPSS